MDEDLLPQWNERHLQQRDFIRQQLRGRGLLDFCEDEGLPNETRRELLLLGRAQDVWNQDRRQHSKLQITGVEATTTDHVQQGIGEPASVRGGGGWQGGVGKVVGPWPPLPCGGDPDALRL